MTNKGSKNNKNIYLLLGALTSAIAALAHVGCIIVGGNWYRFFGAGEQMARLSEQGHWYPTVVTSAIALILAIWALYGLSGARLILKLPLLRLALCLISAIYLIRGSAFFALMPLFPDNDLTFWLVSSSICFVIGCFYTIGTHQQWGNLTRESFDTKLSS